MDTAGDADGKYYFFSYSGADRPVAERIVSALKAAGMRLWCDFEADGIRAGEPIASRLDEALTKCDAYILLLGSRGVERWVGLEVAAAVARHVRSPTFKVIVLRQQGIDHDALPPLLQGFRNIPLPGDLMDQREPYFLGLAGQIAVSGTAPPLPEHACPFPGWEPFEEDQAQFFAGRERETLELLDRLGQAPHGRPGWLSIEGPSGAGKSSLVRAGLIPSVRLRLVHRWKTDAWEVALLRPGHAPIREFARALLTALPAIPGDIATVAEELERSPAKVTDLILRHLPARSGLLLAIDQMEELFTLADRGVSPESPDSEAGRRSDVELLGEALTAILTHDFGERSVQLVTTIRSDFVDQIGRLPGLQAHLNRAVRYHLPPIDAAGMRAAIERPAQVAGLVWEAGLPECIVTDAGRGDGTLPVLAHVLRAVWERRDKRDLTHASYLSLGGFEGALGKSADAIVKALPAGGEERARRLLLSLVKLGHGTEDTRRAVLRSEALLSAGGDPMAEQVLQILSATGTPSGRRLIVVTSPRGETGEPRVGTSPRGEPGEPRVELVHEALIRKWDRLRSWIDESRRVLERREDVESASAAWQKVGRPADALPEGAMISYLSGKDLTPSERELLAQTITARSRDFLGRARARDEKRREAYAAITEADLRRLLADRKQKKQLLLIAACAAVAFAVLCIFLGTLLRDLRRSEAEMKRLLREAVAAKQEKEELLGKYHALEVKLTGTEAGKQLAEVRLSAAADPKGDLSVQVRDLRAAMAGKDADLVKAQDEKEQKALDLNKKTEEAKGLTDQLTVCQKSLAATDRGKELNSCHANLAQCEMDRKTAKDSAERDKKNAVDAAVAVATAQIKAAAAAACAQEKETAVKSAVANKDTTLKEKDTAITGLKGKLADALAAENTTGCKSCCPAARCDPKGWEQKYNSEKQRADECAKKPKDSNTRPPTLPLLLTKPKP